MPVTNSNYTMGGILETIGNIVGTIILVRIIYTAIVILICFFIIRAICKYQAKKNAEEFRYDYLATKIAEETCKRLMIIENNRKEKQEKEDKEE